MNDRMLTASELVAAYATGELSPIEATQNALQAIEDRDGECNAYCLVDADRALEQAKASEVRWRDGNPIGWLDGVPSSIKDMFLTQGWPTVRGSKSIDPDQPWDVELRVHGLRAAPGHPHLPGGAVTGHAAARRRDRRRRAVVGMPGGLRA